jgi:hypothetical protein
MDAIAPLIAQDQPETAAWGWKADNRRLREPALVHGFKEGRVGDRKTGCRTYDGVDAAVGTLSRTPVVPPVLNFRCSEGLATIEAATNRAALDLFPMVAAVLVRRI